MTSEEITALLADLFVAIKAIAGYPIPEQTPPAHLLPLKQMQRMVCQGPCQIKAFYLPEKGVFIDATLDLRNDVIARSVLLHELVHYVQQVSGKFETVPNRCERWYTKERQAYEIQNAYLRENRNPTRFTTDVLPGMCRDSGRIFRN